MDMHLNFTIKNALHFSTLAIKLSTAVYRMEQTLAAGKVGKFAAKLILVESNLNLPSLG